MDLPLAAVVAGDGVAGWSMLGLPSRFSEDLAEVLSCPVAPPSAPSPLPRVPGWIGAISYEHGWSVATGADAPLRRTLKRLGVDWMLEVSIAEWRGDGALVLDHATGERAFVAADALVLATTNMAENSLAAALRERGIVFDEIGDCAAPRQAPYAFHEGRKAALAL